MQKEIALTPEQLYYMGKLMQANYIDYAYIAAMGDINQNISLFESEARAGLVSAGILMEDFSGNLEIDPAVVQVLKPIFFGETETTMDIYSAGDPPTMDIFKYHFHDGAVTEVIAKGGNFLIQSADPLDIRDKVDALLDRSYAAEQQTTETIDESKITRLMSFKSFTVGGAAMIKAYVEAEGILYQETETAMESVTREQFVSDAFAIIKGV